MKISEFTRRDIFDFIRVEKINWNGELEEPDFLSRIYDFGNIQSTDSRFNDAYGDIWQHRINNDDWDIYWMFSDERINLLGDDILFKKYT